MDFKAEMISRITKALKDTIEYRGKTLEEAIAIVREESCAGSVIWAEVLKAF